MPPRPKAAAPRPRPRVAAAVRAASQDGTTVHPKPEPGSRSIQTIDSPPASRGDVIDLSLSSPLGPAHISRRSASVVDSSEPGPSSLALPKEGLGRTTSIQTSSFDDDDDDDADFFLARRRRGPAPSNHLSRKLSGEAGQAPHLDATQAPIEASLTFGDDEESEHSDSSSSSAASERGVNAFGRRKPTAALPEWTRMKPTNNRTRKERSSSFDETQEDDPIAILSDSGSGTEDGRERGRSRSKSRDVKESKKRKKRESLSLTPPPSANEQEKSSMKRAREVIERALGLADDKESQLELDGPPDEGGLDLDAEAGRGERRRSRQARESTGAFGLDEDEDDELDPALAMLYRGRGEKEIRERARREERLRREEEERRWEREREERRRKEREEKEKEAEESGRNEALVLSDDDVDLDLELSLPARASSTTTNGTTKMARVKSHQGRMGNGLLQPPAPGVTTLSTSDSSDTGSGGMRRSSRAKTTPRQKQAPTPLTDGRSGSAATTPHRIDFADVKPGLPVPAPNGSTKQNLVIVRKEKAIVLDDSD